MGVSAVIRRLRRPSRTAVQRPPSRFIEPFDQEGARVAAQLRWLLVVLRLSIALVWIATAAVSLGLWPVAQSLDLLAQVGVPAALQRPMLVGAALLDLALGVATLTLNATHRLWQTGGGEITWFLLLLAAAYAAAAVVYSARRY